MMYLMPEQAPRIQEAHIHDWHYAASDYRYCIGPGCGHREVRVQGEWVPEAHTRWKEAFE